MRTAVRKLETIQVENDSSSDQYYIVEVIRSGQNLDIVYM